MRGSAAASHPAQERSGGWDWQLLILTSLLVLFGLLMIQSAGSWRSDRLYGDPLHFVTRQLLGLGVGAVAAAMVIMAPYRLLRLLAWPAYVGSLLLLLLVVMTPLGHSAKGATRWLSLGGVTLQPSEAAKLALIVVLADYLANNRGRLGDVVGVGLPGLGLLLPMMVLVIFQRDFGTTLILLGLAGVLFIVAGLRWRYVVGGLSTGLALLASLIAIEPYRVRRMTSFLNPFVDPGGSGYQVVQGWIALATGGPFGVGLARGVAQQEFLPEAHNDFIIAVIGEELGAVGFVAAVGLLLLLVRRSFQIACCAPDLFGMLAAAGIGAMFAAQSIINIGVVGGCLPTKGLVLPFLSYGASAAVVHMVSIGVLLKIWMESQLQAARPPDRRPRAGEG